MSSINVKSGQVTITDEAIQIWRENNNVAGMDTEVTLRENRRVSVVGFTNSGVGNPHILADLTGSRGLVTDGIPPRIVMALVG